MSNVLSFDLDGVLANFTKGFTSVGHRLFDTPVLDHASMLCWNFRDRPGSDLDEFRERIMWKEIAASKTFWWDLDVLDPSVMKKVAAVPWERRVFITTRMHGIDVEYQTICWLEKHGVQIPQVIVTDKKTEHAERLGVVAHIDDYYPNCASMRAAHPDWFIALLDRQYNREFQPEWIANGGTVVYSVDHYFDQLQRRGIYC